MKKIGLSALILPFGFIFQIQQVKAQTDAELVTLLKEQIARVSPSVTFSIDQTKREQENVISSDNYSFTLDGTGVFLGLPGVAFTAYFNTEGKPNYFRALMPDAKAPGNLNIDALAAGPDWKQFFLPSALSEKIMLSSWIVEFNTHKNLVSKLTLKFRVAGNLTPVEDWDINIREIAIGYEIENPLAPAKNPADPDYERKLSGLLSATMNVFGAEANISSNLVKNIEDWKISSENYDIKIPLATIWEKMKGDKIMPWPTFMNQLEISKFQVDIYPTNKLDITAWTASMGNFHFLVKRSMEDKPAALSTQLTGGYVNAAATPAPTPGKQAVFEVLAAYSLPESFGGPLDALNSFKPSKAGIVVSTFKDPTDNTLPMFADLGTGNTKVSRGITFLAMVDVDNFRQQNLKTILKSLARYGGVDNPLNSVLFRANLPIPPQPFSDFSASAALNFTKDMNFYNRVFFKNVTIEAKPASGDPEFSLYSTIDVVLNDPAKPLTFKGGFGIQPASLTLTGKVQMEGVLNLPHPYGFPKVSLSNLALTTGIKFSTEIPTPDNIFLSGQMMVNNVVGNVTIGLDQNDVGKNMLLARFCNLNFKSVLDAFCGPLITEKIPRFVHDRIDSTGIRNVYIKLIPPGASTNFIGGYPPPDPGFTDNCPLIPTVMDNDFSPGFKLAGQAQILNWDGNFVFGLEGDMSGLSAGLVAIGNMAPLPTSPLPKLPGNITLFSITGAGGTGRPELFVDLSTRHIINGITNKFSASQTSSPNSVQPTGTFFLQARHSGRVVDILNGSKIREATIQQYDLNRSAAQQFIFESVSDGYYSIKNINSGMYLDVQGGIAQAGTRIWQYVGNRSPAQQFKPVMTSDDYFELQSKLNPELVVEIADAGIINGKNLVINKRKKGAFNQQFRQLMTNMAADPSTQTGYRENQVIYGSGQITVLGVTANAYMDLTTDGFQCTLNGDLQGFLKGSVQATILDFANPLTGVSVSGSVEQTVVKTLEGLSREAIKTAFGIRMAAVFSSISTKVFNIQSITFSGRLESMSSGMIVIVNYRIGGRTGNLQIAVDVTDIGGLARKIGTSAVKSFRVEFESLVGEAEKIIVAVDQAVKTGIEEIKSKAGAAIVLADKLNSDAVAAVGQLKTKLFDAVVPTYTAARDGFIAAARKTEQFLIDFGKFTASTVGKIFNSTYNWVTKTWTGVTSDIKGFITGGDNEERVMKNGPAFLITVKADNRVVTSSYNKEKDNYIPIVRNRIYTFLENWQLIPNNVDGSFYLVSAYQGLLLAKSNDRFLTLIPHESEHKDRERMVMEVVPNEPGWFYLRYYTDASPIATTEYTYAFVNRVEVDGVVQSTLVPLKLKGSNKPNDNGKFKFEKKGDVDWARNKSFPPYILPSPPLVEGDRYYFIGETEQYVYSEGKFRLIPDAETLIATRLSERSSTFLTNNQQVSTVLGIPIPTRKNGSLVQAQNEPEVFILESGKRRWIPDVETFRDLGATDNMVQVVSKADLLAIPLGDPIPSRFAARTVLSERSIYRVAGGDGSVYLIMNKTRRPIPNMQTFYALGYGVGHLKEITMAEMVTVSLGPVMPDRSDGKLLKAVGQTEVYTMERGIRRLIPDAETFNAMGLNWGSILEISIADMAEIPMGPALISMK